MIIKKRNLRGKVEKTEPKKVEAQVSDAQISEVKNIEQQPVVEEVVQEISQPQAPQEPEIDLFDIENIDFTQRQERRRGSRRRGYRRIDDRNLVSRAQEEAETIKKSAFEEGYRKGLEQANSDLEAFKNNFSEFMNAPKNVFEFRYKFYSYPQAFAFLLIDRAQLKIFRLQPNSTSPSYFCTIDLIISVP